ncbi:MinD/ParA family protein [Gracilibacillus marinus]|jgi:flagellar biosynthesis protein FlhG|uniref:MinD/ParA family protein n=1 Tax=Gracilibacillus marinus TaxID=630535 RepID=A0ABV8VU15_9BACI
MEQDQAAKLRSRIKSLHGNYEAKTIAIVSGKGGVGKSNFALNFSISLQDKGKKVLLIDLDIGMGNIDILLGQTSTYSIIQMLEKKIQIYDIIESGPKGLSYITGGSAHNEIFTVNNDNSNYFIEQLELVFNQFDFIIFDMGAGVTKESIQFILAADECIVLTTPEPTSLTDGYAMVKHILSYKNMSLHLVVNRVLNEKQGKQVVDRFSVAVSKFLNAQIVPLGYIPDDSSVSKAVIKQIPFTTFNSKSNASVALMEMTNQFLGIVPRKEKGSNFLKNLLKYFAEG